jgi:hypothetical protein
MVVWRAPQVFSTNQLLPISIFVESSILTEKRSHLNHQSGIATSLLFFPLSNQWASMGSMANQLLCNMSLGSAHWVSWGLLFILISLAIEAYRHLCSTNEIEEEIHPIIDKIFEWKLQKFHWLIKAIDNIDIQWDQSSLHRLIQPLSWVLSTLVKSCVQNTLY